MAEKQIAILGCGNLGRAIALGLVFSKKFEPSQITVTRKQIELLKDLKRKGENVTTNNKEAVKNADIVIISVRPKQIEALLNEVKEEMNENQLVISVALNVTINEIRKYLGDKISVVRVMPNIAIEIGESMTCLCGDKGTKEALKKADELFGYLGSTLIIEEKQMTQATALCACGVAYFLRSIRAASQGGVEIGFHAEDAIMMAAQTAKGSAALLLQSDNHPEVEIDKVTTPNGITIKGLNHMESLGFSSAMVAGIKLSAEKGLELLKDD
jgi:pyrroline-5-carboxylate reductase